ncbi:TetR/AcrR family transcriptional regulator [Acetobacter senegalensis]|uniref:TetR/AcrR family transcriptional regulator n=1 Tax=Acetobacter senegalensis TaxID=446692 RepID=UPI001EDC5715|nr:TetR/AcrR family transcriptional regulator [Acetobacter senegalensis]MCG4261943.1 TetR/AcrR family transcriptional regulator [Acetobacter senegalensis]
MSRQDNGHDFLIRESIIQNAAELFARFGPTKTTMADIAKCVQMSPANIYNFFDSKNEIMEAVGQKIFSGVSEKIRVEIKKRQDYFDRLSVLFIFIHRFIQKNITPSEDVMRLQLVEGLKDWEYAKNFEIFVLNQTTEILMAAVAETDDRLMRCQSDARIILDCLSFGVVYSNMFRNIEPKEHEARLVQQLDLVRDALRVRGYRI